MAQQQSGRLDSAPYELEPPTAGHMLENVTDLMGERDGREAWRRACETARIEADGAGHDLATLMRVMQAMALQGGLAQVVARSNIIRLHTFATLTRLHRIRGGTA